MAKYKLTWKDLKLEDFKIYLFAMFKAFIPKKKIKNLEIGVTINDKLINDLPLNELFKILNKASLDLSVVGLSFNFFGGEILKPPLFPPIILIKNVKNQPCIFYLIFCDY